jgi:2-polyprenyl-3-methyl-5-hydroxy-6-metoxy-1,4-benzoquinol methylase
MIDECLFCGDAGVERLSKETRLVRSAFGAAVVRCRRCGLVFVSPRPAEPEKAYEQPYFDAYAMAGQVQVGEAHVDRQGRRLRRVAPGPGRLLEIGVGHGGFLRQAREQGWDAVGLDVSQWAAAEVSSRVGVPVIVGTVADAGFSSGAFDLVHMSHVLEHVPDPLALLGDVKRVLKPSGHVIIEVPNELENLYTWWRLRSRTARPYPVPSTHLWFFSARTLQRAVRAAGFEIDGARTFRDVSDARPLRRLGKRIVSAVERLVDRAPLIEVIARPRAGHNGS